MLILVALAAIYCAGAGTVLVRFGIRSWRHQASLQPRMQAVLLTDAMKAGIERSLMEFGAFHYFLGAVIVVVGSLKAAGIMGGGHRLPSVLLAFVLLCLLGGVILTSWTAIAIILFNRPRFLVPPHLRHQPGTMSRRGRGSTQRKAAASGLRPGR